MNRNILYIAWLMLIAIVGQTFGVERQEVIDAYRNEPTGSSVYRKRGIMDGNQVRTMYYNQAEVGHWPDQPSGEWPKGSGHSYLDGVCMLVGAKVAVNIAGIDTFITPMEAAYREHFDKDPVTGTPWGWEPIPGYLNIDISNNSPAISNNANSWPLIWPDAVFTALDQPVSEWINEAEVNGEEGVDDDRDGVVDNKTYWNGYFGRGVKNADIETYFPMDDASDQEWTRFPYFYYPIHGDTTRGGLGLRVDVRGFQWSHVLAEDNIFWLYDIVNISDTTYNETVFGFLTDVGVGGTNDSGDDYASFDIDLDIAYAYDEDGQGNNDLGIWGPTGYMGYAYLESPGDATNGEDDDGDGMIDEARDDGIDNDGDWAPFTDLNGNSKWDENEPLNDDLGSDGVGPYDRQYNGPDPDSTQGNGRADAGEPDFDRTDIDESDQIGLNSMSIYRLVDQGGGDGWPKHDNGLYQRMSSTNFDTSLQRANIHMLFASGPFILEQGATQRFSMALLYGNDLDDLVNNKRTVQNIYNANYNFSKPPYKPVLTAVAGDGKVNLFWDAVAEESRDAFLPDSMGNPKKDFEGYLIYRSREPQFEDIKIITDSQGNDLFYKPIAQFDLVDGIVGPDPIGVDGARFYRGDDTGLKHSYVDEDVENGVTYYYACVSYDMGDPEKGDDDDGLPPTECTKIITEDLIGNITNIDINCAVVTPNAPAPGYVPPEVVGNLDEVTSGVGSGSIGVEVLDPEKIKDNATYRVVFNSAEELPDYTTDSYDIYEVVGDSLHEVISAVDVSSFGSGYLSPVVDGFAVYANIDTPTTVVTEKSGWLIGSSNLQISLNPHVQYSQYHVPWPCDYKIQFFDEPADTTIFLNNIPVNFKIINMTSDYQTDIMLSDNDNSGDLTMGDIITIVEKYDGNGDNFNDLVYDVNYFGPPMGQQPIHPVAGDEYLISSSKQFYQGDYFEFRTTSASEDTKAAKDGLDDIKVVPNPYICGASWEARLVFGSGRGERKIDFIHLPSQCTIRIFTLAGKLVKKIEHNNPYTNGAESWNLVSDDGMDIAYGVYVFHIKAPGVGEKIGKFAVIK